MNKLYKNFTLIGLTILLLGITNSAIAQSDIVAGEDSLYQAATALTQNEKDFYINKASDFFQKAYDKNPKNKKAIIGLGKTLAYKGSQADSKNVLLSGYSLYPDSPEIQAAIGDYYYIFKEYNNALEFYKLALSCGYLKNYRTNYSTATCYEKLGDIKNAKLYYEITLMINPRHKEAKNRLSSLENMYQYKQNTEKKNIFESNKSDDDEDDIDINTIIDNCHNLK